MSIHYKAAIVFSVLLLSGKASAAAHNLTIKYEVLKKNIHFADVIIRVNDTYLRTDYLINNVKLTEMTEKWKGQYIIDHNTQRASFIDYNVIKERGDKAMQRLLSQVKTMTAEQMFAMSIDPINDESEYIEYQNSTGNKLVGTRDSDVVNEVQYLEVPNKFMTQKQYDWFIKRATEDCRFGKGFVAILDDPISEQIRRINYQYPVLPVHIKNANFDIKLKSVSADKLNDSELKVEQGVVIVDSTEAIIQFNKRLSSLYPHIIN